MAATRTECPRTSPDTRPREPQFSNCLSPLAGLQFFFTDAVLAVCLPGRPRFMDIASKQTAEDLDEDGRCVTAPNRIGFDVCSIEPGGRSRPG
ncbi:Uu.00g021650.m01.CDS01 [Anthostomella pinea]|uniref:Uu.00g021650.m01.CDS01 n=1 Tax=Anthostomella pinea TaxID=933095 RepID=A0AAI8YQZ6_9PEZI|nr:Uu.00g021650.m01.CDS01 [Anthostomella pinea]